MSEIQRLEDRGHYQMSGKSVLCGSLAGVAVGGPLLGMMGFSFLASLTLLLIASPLLLIFSPLLFCAGLFLAAGVGTAAAMAVAGTSALGWVVQQLRTSWTARRLPGHHRARHVLVDGGHEAGKQFQQTLVIE